MAKNVSPSCGFRLFIFLVLFIFVPTFCVDKCSTSNSPDANNLISTTDSNSTQSTSDSTINSDNTINSGNSINSTSAETSDGNLAPEDIIQKQIERALKQVFPDGTGSSGYAQTNNSYYKDSDGLYHFSSYVMDTANVLGSKGPQLEAQLVQLEKDTGMEVAVLTVNSLGGADIESFSMKYAEKWKIGSKAKDNGLLVTFALQDRAVRLETGYGTEGYLTDAKCARIIRNTMIPAFKEGNYAQGLYDGTMQAVEIMKGAEDLFSESEGSEASEEEEEGGLGVVFLIVALWFFIGFSPLFCKILTLIFPTFFLGSGLGGSHHSGGGFGGGSFGGGGFGGGHGGGFGGGGASGHW